MKPFLVEVFGIDGAGKSTLTHLMEEEFNKRGYPSQILTPLRLTESFPSETFSLIRKIQKEKHSFHKRANSFLAGYYSFALVNNFFKIFPQQCDVLICDRYISSHILNQKSFGEELDDLQPLFDLLPKPHSSIMVDVPLDVALERIGLRGSPKEHENIDYLQRSRDLHLEYAQLNNIPILSGTLAQNSLLQAAMKLCMQNFEKNDYEK